ncbi:MAG: flagellar hook-basal body protein [Planctomycetota bacterium]|jgi:flagellar basal-body rod protein FlgG
MAIMALNTAATGLSALETALDVIANNLANVNTPGFKASRVNFEDLLYSEEKYPGVENANGDRRPIGLYVGLGVTVSGTQLDTSQGVAEETSRQLDILIDGDGYFQVEIEDDIGDGIGYTRTRRARSCWPRTPAAGSSPTSSCRRTPSRSRSARTAW